MKAIYTDTDKARLIKDGLTKCIQIISNNSIDDLIGVVVDYKDYCKQIYQEELKKICAEFAQPYEEVKLTTYTLNHSDIWCNMATARTEKRRVQAKEIYNSFNPLLSTKDRLFAVSLIDNDRLKDEADKQIKEYCTLYTCNDRQDEAVKELNKISDSLNKLNKMGIHVNNLHNFLQMNNTIKHNSVLEIR